MAEHLHEVTLEAGNVSEMPASFADLSPARVELGP